MSFLLYKERRLNILKLVGLMLAISFLVLVFSGEGSKEILLAIGLILVGMLYVFANASAKESGKLHLENDGFIMDTDEGKQYFKISELSEFRMVVIGFKGRILARGLYRYRQASGGMENVIRFNFRERYYEYLILLENIEQYEQLKFQVERWIAMGVDKQCFKIK